LSCAAAIAEITYKNDLRQRFIGPIKKTVKCKFLAAKSLTKWTGQADAPGSSFYHTCENPVPYVSDSTQSRTAHSALSYIHTFRHSPGDQPLHYR